MNNDIEWIPSYCCDLWEVNKQGQIRNKKNHKILKGNIVKNRGYVEHQRGSDRKKFQAHRIIYFSFHPDEIEDAENYIIDHINGIRTDNRLENLRKTTQKANLFFRNEYWKNFLPLLDELVQVYGYEETYQKIQALCPGQTSPQ